MLQDADGDTDTATLTIHATDPKAVDPVAYKTVDADVKAIAFDEVLNEDTTDAEIILFDVAKQMTVVANDENGYTAEQYDKFDLLVEGDDTLTNDITDFVIATENKDAHQLTDVEVPQGSNIIDLAKIYGAEVHTVMTDDLVKEDTTAILVKTKVDTVFKPPWRNLIF